MKPNQKFLSLLSQVYNRSRLWLIIIVVIVVVLAQQGLQPLMANAQDSLLAEVLVQGSNGAMTPQETEEPHLQLSPVNATISAADLEQADDLVKTLKEKLAKYEQIENAEAAGYRQFPPNTKGLKIVHLVNPGYSIREHWRLNPEKPGALLYIKQATGELKLLGAMFTAPAKATFAELDKRIPLSLTRWHLHTNLCLPKPIWDKQQWQQKKDGQPVFGTNSPIATKAACQEVGGEFKPSVLGWMVHINAFAPNLQDIFNYQYGG